MARTFKDITHPDDLENDLRNVHQLLNNEIISYQAEKRYVHKDGRVVVLSWMGTWSEEARRHYFVGRDLTETYTLALNGSAPAVRTPIGLVAHA